MHPRPSSRLAPLVSLVLACGGSASVEQTTAEPEGAAVASGSEARTNRPPTEVPPTQVTLLDAGDGEPSELRFRPEVGQVTRTRLRQHVTSLAIQLGTLQGQPAEIPPIDSVFETEVASIDPGGAVRREWRILSLEVVGTSAVADRLRQLMMPLATLSGWEIVDARGRLLAADWRVGADLTPELQRSIERTGDAIRQLTPPLPEEPVAIGARWRAEAAIQTDYTLQQSITYTLTGRQGDTLELAVEVNQHADAQVLPSSTPGITERLLGLASSGEGRLVMDLGTMQTTSRSRVETEIESERAPDEGDAVRSRIQMTLELQSGPADPQTVD